MASGMEKLGVKSDNEVIKENEKWFKFYLILPTISAIVVAVACFVLGIVFAADGEGDWAIPAFWFGGALVAWLSYISLKIMLSYSILHIYYLKKLTRVEKPIKEVEEIKEEDLPTI